MKEIKTTTGIIIIVAAAVLVGGGALTYFYYALQSIYDFTIPQPVYQKSEFDSNDFNLSGEVKIISHPPQDQLSGWQIYQNDNYKFQFFYPNDWNATQHYELSEVIDLYPAGQRPEIEGELTGAIVVRVYKNPKKLDLYAFYEDLNQGNPFRDATKGIEKIKIANIEGFRFNGVVGLWVYTIVTFPIDNLIYEFTDQGERHLKDGLFDNSVATFQLIQ